MIGLLWSRTVSNIDVTFEEPAAEPETTVIESAGKPRRPWFLLALVVVASILVGAGAATGVLLLTGQNANRYTVNVWLNSDATAEQKAAIQAALPAFDPIGEVKFEDHEAAFKRFQELYKDSPEFADVSKDAVPESFQLETKGRRFDCTGYDKVRHMPGVSKVQVIQDRVNHYVAVITCDSEYKTS